VLGTPGVDADGKARGRVAGPWVVEREPPGAATSCHAVPGRLHARGLAATPAGGRLGALRAGHAPPRGHRFFLQHPGGLGARRRAGLRQAVSAD